jgi:hypothetical protein
MSLQDLGFIICGGSLLLLALLLWTGMCVELGREIERESHTTALRKTEGP